MRNPRCQPRDLGAFRDREAPALNAVPGSISRGDGDFYGSIRSARNSLGAAPDRVSCVRAARGAGVLVASPQILVARQRLVLVGAAVRTMPRASPQPPPLRALPLSQPDAQRERAQEIVMLTSRG